MLLCPSESMESLQKTKNKTLAVANGLCKYQIVVFHEVQINRSTLSSVMHNGMPKSILW